MTYGALVRVGWTAVCLAFVGLARLILNVVAWRWFDGDSAGALNVALATIALVAMPVSSSLGAAVTRFVAQARGAGDEALATDAMRKTLVGSVVGALLVVALAFYGTEGSTSALLVGLVYTFYLVTRAALYAVDEVGFYSKLEAIGFVGFVGALGLVVTAGLRFDLHLALLASYGVVFVGGLVRLKSWMRPVPSRHKWPDIMRFAAVASVGTAASLAIREIHILYLADAGSLPSAGFYGAVLAALMPVQLLPRMLRQVVFTDAARFDGSEQTRALGNMIWTLTWLLFVTTLPLLSAGYAVRDQVFGWMGVPEMALRDWICALVVAAAWVDVIATPSANALPGAGFARVTASSAVAALGLAVLVMVIGPGNALERVALSALVGSIVKGGIPLVFAARQYGAPVTSGNLLRVAGLVVVAGCVGHPSTPEPIALVAWFGLTMASLLALRQAWQSIRRASLPQ